MDMTNFRPELHVAQQRRRDKLRIQHTSIRERHHLETYANNLEQFSTHQGVLSPEFMQHRNNFRYDNISYDPGPITSEMLNVMGTSQAVLADKNVMMMDRDSTVINRPDKAVALEDASFSNLSQTLSSTLDQSAKVRGDPRNCSSTAWKSFGSQPNSALVANYTCGSAGIGSNTIQMFVGDCFSGAMKMINASASTVDLKPSNYYGSNDVESSFTNPSSDISSQHSQKHYENMHIDSSSFCQNTLQDVVTPTTLGNPEVKMVSFALQNVKEMGRGSWADAGNELVLLPGYSDPSNRTYLNYSSGLVSRRVEGSHRWIDESNFPASKISERDPRTVGNDCSSTQALSLSLSSAPMPKVNGDSKSFKSGPKPSIGDKFMEYSHQDMVGISTFNHRNVGPLGPFTGYATILRWSKFLRPAQELLNESCNIINPKSTRPTESNTLAEEIRVSGDAINADEPEFRAKIDESGGSSSAFCANENSQEGRRLSSSNASLHPDYLMKKAKLLYMQEEVCRRYKQYHQQMQMAVSSFESVAGLSSATPYFSLSVKTISSHFRCLRNAILDQLRNTRKALGEDFSSPTTGTSNSKGDTTTSRLKSADPSFQKLKAGGGSVGFFEPHVWRPQRGLPERAVAVLRAWLFDHFLHPYPTDADKHVLATQTGLSKNQVSNWFINARVRVWKPMVEEIHTLEAKGVAASASNTGRTGDEKPYTEGTRGQNVSQQMNYDHSSASRVPDGRIECSDIGCSSSSAGNQLNPMWIPDKRLRFECHTPANMEGSLVNFMPYQRSGIEIGSLGAVSLTLGLRQSTEGAQQQLRLQQPQHDQFLQHLGGHFIHDFVG